MQQYRITYDAVAPRLLHDPLDGVVPIIALGLPEGEVTCERMDHFNTKSGVAIHTTQPSYLDSCGCHACLAAQQ